MVESIRTIDGASRQHRATVLNYNKNSHGFGTVRASTDVLYAGNKLYFNSDIE
jgi:hypothetical protein